MRGNGSGLWQWMTQQKENLRLHPAWVGLLLTAVVLFLIIWLVQDTRQETRIRQALEANFRREFGSLVEHLQQGQNWLDKTKVSATNQKDLYLAHFAFEMKTAQASLSQLPLHDLNLSESRKFLAQAADYALVLSNRASKGEAISGEEERQLDQFSETLRNYQQALQEIARRQNQPGFSWVDVHLGRASVGPARARPEISRLESLRNLEEDLSKLPVLVYDGPFSDQPSPRRPKGVNQERIEADDAKQAAENFLGRTGAQKKGRTRVTPVAGDMAVFSVTMQAREGRAQADISQAGGHVIWYLHDRMPQQTKWSLEQAHQRALDFLKKQGFDEMHVSYQVEHQNSLTIVFVAQQDGVILYPDQIKIQVALDDGQIIAWDASGYYMSHHERQLAKPKIDQNQVEQNIKAAGFPLKKIRLALIPSAGGSKEVLTWEVQTEWKGNDYLIYIDALSGEQERILKLVEVQGGSLAQ